MSQVKNEMQEGFHTVQRSHQFEVPVSTYSPSSVVL